MYHEFPSKFFRLSAKKLRSGTLLCLRTFLIRTNFVYKRGGEGGSVMIFPQNFVSVPNNFVGERFTVFLIWGIENFTDNRGGVNHDSPSNLCCLTIPKFFIEEPFCNSQSLG